MTAPYTTGQVTLVNGSAAVVGVGTGWATALIAGGVLYVEADGNALPILGVTDNTHLTAAVKWKGASGTYPYAIVRDTAYLQQLTANSQALASLMQVLGGEALTALAALPPAADKIPYFNGPASAALADVKAKGRDILGADTLTTFLSKLGPVFGGPAPVPSAAGLGFADGDLNPINVPGIYTIAGIWANGPNGPGGGYTGVLEVRRRSFNNFFHQRLILNNGQEWTRWTIAADAASWPNAWYRSDVTRQSHDVITLADDSVYTKAFSGNAIGWGIVTGQFGNTPNMLFSFRAIASAVIQKMAGAGTSNVYNQTVLTGTTGADASLNIGVSTNTIYVENRIGSSIPFSIVLFASIP